MSIPAADARPSSPRRHGIDWLWLLGVVLIIGWAYWWGLNLSKGVFLDGGRTWVPAWGMLGVDQYHTYLAARHWIAGGNPYIEDFGDPLGQRFVYSPLLLVLFAWCALLELGPAVALWTLVNGVVLGALGAACAKVRRAISVSPRIPGTLATALILFSTPALLAIERGNHEPLVPLLLLMAAWFMRRQTTRNDAAAGACLAAAVFLKQYPLLVLPALLLFGRRRALMWTIGFCVVLGAAMFQLNLDSVRAQMATAAKNPGLPGWYGHSLSGSWKYLSRGTPAAQVPPLVAAGVVLAPLAGWVAWRLSRAIDRNRLLWPALLFFAQVATFWFPVSFDYKLIFLPLVMLCLWDRRDPWYVHALLLPVLVYLQPIRLPLTTWTLIALKVLALMGAGLCLSHKARHLPPPPQPPPQHAGPRCLRGGAGGQ